MIFLLAFIGSLFALAGGILFLYNQKWTKFLISYSVPFAAGVLLTVSLVGMLPEAFEMSGEGVFTAALLAFLGAYVFENFVFNLHHHKDCTHCKHLEKSVALLVLGDTIHNFIDGVAIAATYLIMPGLGIATAISTFLHEFPHEISDFGILLKAGWKKNKIIWIKILSSLATFLGVFFVLFVSKESSLVGMLLALAAGLFLYLGASDFLPRIEEDKKLTNKQSFAALFSGILIMLLVINLVPS